MTASKEALKSIHTELSEGNEKLIKAINDGFSTLAAAFTATSLPGNELAGSGFPPAHPPAPPSAPPPVAPPVAPSVTSMYGMPGYASSYAATPPSAPVTPAMPPGSNLTGAPTTPAMPPGLSMASGSMGSAPMAEQPTRPLVLTVKDEAGQTRKAAVSPTRHAPGSQLPGAYLNEFGLGCVSHAGGFHRRLPDVFLPK